MAAEIEIWVPRSKWRITSTMAAGPGSEDSFTGNPKRSEESPLKSYRDSSVLRFSAIHGDP
jgi:hypothetical protein